MIHFLRIGPRRWLYFGHEDEVPEAKVWEPFWFIEENPPHRIGNGWRMKEVRDLAFHFGMAVRFGARTEMEILGGSTVEATPTEIGRWGAEATESDDAGTDPPAPDPAVGPRAGDLHRVGADAGQFHPAE